MMAWRKIDYMQPGAQLGRVVGVSILVSINILPGILGQDFDSLRAPWID